MERISNWLLNGQDNDSLCEAVFTVAYNQAQSLIDSCESSFASEDERTMFAMALVHRCTGEESEMTATVLREVNRAAGTSVLDEKDVLRLVGSAYSDDSPEWQHLEVIRQSPDYAGARERYRDLIRYWLQ